MSEPLTVEELDEIRRDMDRGQTSHVPTLWSRSRRLLATLDASNAPAPLDVERLAAAFHRAMNHGYHGGGWDNGDGDIAAAIAGEYARLSEPSR